MGADQTGKSKSRSDRHSTCYRASCNIGVIWRRLVAFVVTIVVLKRENDMDISDEQVFVREEMHLLGGRFGVDLHFHPTGRGLREWILELWPRTENSPCLLCQPSSVRQIFT